MITFVFTCCFILATGFAFIGGPILMLQGAAQPKTTFKAGWDLHLAYNYPLRRKDGFWSNWT